MSEKIDLVPVTGNVTKEQVRAMFPKVTEFADECRAVFGNGVKLVYAEENGRCIGKQSVSDPENTVKVSEMVFDPKPDDQDGYRYKGKRNGKR
ncbi:MAG: hypothetical protein JSR71_09300 [Proteobacteria bacterium]|nr:hypothetical protein [Pseudomonadota bacterium]